MPGEEGKPKPKDMKTQNIKQFLVIICAVLMGYSASAQEDPINADLLKASWEQAFKNGNDFCTGIGVFNFHIAKEKGNSDFSDYLPNAYNIYGGYSSITPMRKNVYIAVDFLLGKRGYSSSNDSKDTVNLFTASKYSDYYISVPIRYGFMKETGKFSFFAYETGVYLTFQNLDSKISNSSGERRMPPSMGENSEMLWFDWGWANKFTWGFHALYLQAGLDFGLRNLAPDDTDYLLKNTYNLNFTIGYRFGSDIHKKDMKRVNKVKNKFTGEDDKKDDKKKDKRGDVNKGKKGDDKKDDDDDDDKKNKRGGVKRKKR